MGCKGTRLQDATTSQEMLSRHCFICHQPGHSARNCSTKQSGTQASLFVGVTKHQPIEEVIQNDDGRKTCFKLCEESDSKEEDPRIEMCFIATKKGKDNDPIDISNFLCCTIAEDILSPDDLTLLLVAGSGEKEISKIALSTLNLLYLDQLKDEDKTEIIS